MSGPNRIPHTPELLDAVVALRADGLTNSGIAAQIRKRFGLPISRSAVAGVIDRARKRGVAIADPVKPATTRRQPRQGGAPPVRRMSKQLPVAPIASVPIALEKSLVSQCHWPLWPHEDTGAPDFMVCGAEKGVTDGPYCAGHAHMARGTGGIVKRWNFR